MISIALSFLGRFWPYLVAGAVGFSAAWSLQGIRLDNAKAETVEVQQAFDSYKLEQERLAYEAAEGARKQREDAERDWRKKYADLQKDGDVFKRCVAAGKCGWVRGVPGQTPGTLSGVSPSLRLDATGPHPVSAAGEPAAPPVITECALTTLMLNALQADIEKQKGY